MRKNHNLTYLIAAGQKGAIAKQAPILQFFILPAFFYCSSSAVSISSFLSRTSFLLKPFLAPSQAQMYVATVKYAEDLFEGIITECQKETLYSFLFTVFFLSMVCLSCRYRFHKKCHLKGLVGGTCWEKINTWAMLERLKFFDSNCKTPYNKNTH